MTATDEQVERVARALIACRHADDDMPADDVPTTDYDRDMARAAIAALPPQGDGWQDIASGLAKALRRLSYHAQTSGGTAGHDAGLVAAVEIGLAALRVYDTAKHDAPPAAEIERTKE